MGRIINPGLGEQLDRCTILELKIAQAITEGTGQQVHFDDELSAIKALLPMVFTTPMHELHNGLAEVNTLIWDAEDKMRDCRRRKHHLQTTEMFEVAELGMLCQELNDQRSTIIQELNLGNNDGWIEKAETEVV